MLPRTLISWSLRMIAYYPLRARVGGTMGPSTVRKINAGRFWHMIRTGQLTIYLNEICMRMRLREIQSIRPVLAFP